jgi:hypothetical protein
MNYGPSLMATLEVGVTGNFAPKSIAVRLALDAVRPCHTACGGSVE